MDLNLTGMLSHKPPVVEQDGKIYYGFLADGPIAIPPPLISEHHGDLNVIKTGRTWQDLLKPTRWNEPYGWAAFIPKVPFLSYPFHVLDCYALPDLDDETKLWSIPQSRLTEWDRLFQNVRFLCLRLSHVYQSPICEPYPPHAWGYHAKYKSYHKAIRCIERSREWFQVWFGLLSYLIARAETEEPDERPEGSVLRPHWRQFIVKEGLPIGWVDGLAPARWTHLPRAGTIIEGDFSGRGINKLGYRMDPLHLCIKYMVPTWYIWNEWCANEYANNTDAGLPPMDIRRRLLGGVASLSEQAKEPEEEEETDEQWRARRRGTSWWDRLSQPQNREKRRAFITEKMAELERADQARRAKETPKEAQQTLSRQKNPGVGRSPVYLWDRDPELLDPTILVRELVLGSERANVLADHTDNQIRFFAALNVWHVCADLAAGEWVPNEDDEEDEAHDHQQSDHHHEPEPAAAIPDPLPNIDDHQPPDRFQDIQEVRRASSSLTRHFECEINETFGWVPPLLLPAPTDLVAQKEEKDLVRFFRALGRAYGWQKDAANTFLRSPAAISAWSLYESFTSTLDKTHATDAFDLNIGCPRFIRRDLVGRIRIIERPGARPLYMFDLEGEEDFHVAVYSPIVALAVCRSNPRDKRDAVKFLYNYGAPFQTLMEFADPAPPFVEQYPPTIPRRPRGYKFGPTDYTSYVQGITREIFKKSRAAVLRGGYVWRLSSQFLYFEDALEGPSKNHSLELKWAGMKLVDDMLTAVDEDIIVGTYLVDDGRGGTYTVSWWPPADMFDASLGENYEYWTDWNEVGFLERQKKIRAGLAVPLTRQEWKGKLKGLKQTKVWKGLLHQRSEMFIQEEVDRFRRRNI